MDISNHSYDIAITVRDYECDVQGIVNNAVYNNYFEHARNTLIKKLGSNLHTLHHNGQTPVVARAEIDYIHPLVGGDECIITSTYQTKGSYKLLFFQDLVKTDGKVLCAKALFTVAVILDAKPLAISKSIFAAALT